jgi:hypothetical protein
MFLLTSFVLYAFALQAVRALPTLKRIVVSPQITKPGAGTTWTPGETDLVTWYVDLFGHYLPLCTYFCQPESC